MFLVAMKDDSIDGIFKTLNEAALISKASGGIGIHVHNIRSMARILPAPMGIQTGWYPCCVFTTILQGMSIKVGSKRPGAFAIYIEPWHGDIFDILEMRKIMETKK